MFDQNGMKVNYIDVVNGQKFRRFIQNVHAFMCFMQIGQCCCTKIEKLTKMYKDLNIHKSMN